MDWKVHLKNSTLPVACAFSQITPNPPTSEIPLITTIAIETIMMTACRASVQRTALNPPSDE
jgi:hypothetical protein